MFRKIIASLALAVGITAAAQAPTLVGPNTFTPGTNAFNSPLVVGKWAACGDSLTAGYEGVTSLGSFPYDLQGMIGAPIANYGVGGTTSTQIAVKCGVSSQSMVNTIIEADNGVSNAIPACSRPICSNIQVGFNLGYEPTANSTTGGGVVPVTGTINASANIHGTVAENSLYQWDGTHSNNWSLSGGSITVNYLVNVAANTHTFAAGDVVEVTGINGLTGCTMPINGTQTLSGGTSSSITYSAGGCTGGPGNGGVVALYTFTPDSYTLGATITPGTSTYTPDAPCPGCSLITWVGRNNINASNGVSTVEGSSDALYALFTTTPAGAIFVALPVIPENISSEWETGGANYSNLTNYKGYLKNTATYKADFVDVWNALQTAANLKLNTDAQDVKNSGCSMMTPCNDGIPTSLRAITAVGTLHTAALSTDMNIYVDVTQGSLIAGQVVTLDVGNAMADENISCTGVTGTSNPYELTGCTRGYGHETPLPHSSGVSVQQDDGTHLNAAGYAVVAQAIATHLSIPSATTGVITPLSGANTYGSYGIQTPITIGGNTTGGIQIQFGNTANTGNSVGTIESSGNTAVAFNAVQSGGYATDQWTQPNQSTNQTSYLETMGVNGWALYHALSGASNAAFNSFWAYVAPTGTVVTTASSNTVTGSGTNFTTSLILGSSLTVGTETKVVQSIASDTSLTTTATFSNTNESLATVTGITGGTYSGTGTLLLSSVGACTGSTATVTITSGVFTSAVVTAGGSGCGTTAPTTATCTS